MPDKVSNNKRLAKNTLYLYLRTMIVMIISLYTSRVLLQAIGVEDFGIYNLVGGITAMISFLNGTLADGTQRFITFEIGKGYVGRVNKIYSTCMILHIALAIIVVIVLEPIGVWFINNKLQIPADRLIASLWVFHFMLLQLFLSVISVPYNALIIAHEKMSAFAMVSVFESCIRLSISFVLMACSSIDRLVFYGFLLMISQLLIRSIYIYYCKHNFKTIKFKYEIDKPLIKEIGNFAIWTIIGNFAWICVTQGLNLLLGVFFQPAINAARGIAVQVQQALTTFVKNFQTAINPQITKTYAADQLDEMHTLIFRSSRLSFFLLMFPLIPIFVDAEIILHLWLKTVPNYTTEFIRIILLVSWFNTLGNPLAVGAKASGRIKKYELCSASAKLAVLPIGYITLYLGCQPYSVFVIYLIFEIIALVLNIIITRKLIHFSLHQYTNECLARIIPVSIITIMVPLVLANFMAPSLLRFVFIVLSTCVIGGTAIYFIGLTKDELKFINAKLKVLMYGR